MSGRVEVLGKVVDNLKEVLWVEHTYEIFSLSFVGMYESLDDFLWDASIEATLLLLPTLDLGPETQYTNEQLNTLTKLTVNFLALKTNYCLSELALNYGR